MNALGVICFLALFGVYAVGQEFSRRIMGLQGDSFLIRFHRAARQPVLYALSGMVGVLLSCWAQARMSAFYPAFYASTAIVFLIALVRAVELPRKNK